MIPQQDGPVCIDTVFLSLTKMVLFVKILYSYDPSTRWTCLYRHCILISYQDGSVCIDTVFLSLTKMVLFV